MQTANNLLLEILTIIQYKDKEGFVEEFTTFNQIEAIQNLAHKLPEDLTKKTEFTKEDYESIQQHITKQEFLREVDAVAQEELKKYVETISPSLTLEQKQQIDALMRKFKSNRSHRSPWGFLTRIKKKIFR
jgi:hypothetical protein